MANNEKITELIDEKAFREWERFVESLKTGQTEMAKTVEEAVNLNKSLKGADSLGKFSKEAEKTAIALEKVAQAQAKTRIDNEKAKQAELKTIEMTERRIVSEEKKRIALEKSAEAQVRASKFSEKALKTIEKGAKDASSSMEQAGDFIVQNSKDIEQGLKSAEAVARTFSGELKETSTSAQIFEKQIRESDTILEQYGISIEGLIRRGIQLKKEFEDNKTTFKEYGNSLNPQDIINFNVRQKELQEAMRQNGVETKRLTREQLSAEGSTDRLGARLDTLKGIYRGLSKEERETSETASKLKKEIDQLDESFKEQKKSIGENQVFVGQYENALNALPGPLGNVADSLQAVIVKLRTMIATPVGAIIAIIGAVVAGGVAWYEYNKNLAESTRLTKQFTDLAGNDLKAYRSEVQAISDVFGKDFKEVLIASNTLVKEFGISWAESLDLLEKGFVAGADANGEMLDSVREYSSQLRSAGITAEEVISIINTQVKEGIFSDKGVDAIKEATLRIREMTPATATALERIGLSSKTIQDQLTSGTKTMFQVIQEVSVAMNKFGDNSAEVGVVLADVFGGAGEDAGVRFIKNLGDINTGLDESIKKQEDIAKAQMSQVEANKTLNNVIAQLFDKTGGGFELWIANLKLISTKWLVEVINKSIELYNWFVDFYNQSMILRAGVASAISYYKTMFDIIAGGFRYITNLAGTFGSVMKAIFTGNLAEIPGIIRDGWQEYLNNSVRLGRAIGGNIAKGIRDTFGGTMDKLVLNNGTTGALTDPNGEKPTGGAGDGTVGTPEKEKNSLKKRNDETKDAISLEKALANAISAKNKMLEKEAELEAKNLKSISESESSSTQTRIEALNAYNTMKEKAIEAGYQSEKASNEKALAEIIKLEKENRNAEAEAIRETVLDNNRRLELERRSQTEELARETSASFFKILSDSYEKGFESTTWSLLTSEKEQEKILSQRYKNGEINERQYQEEKENLIFETNKNILLDEINLTEKIIELAKLKGVEVGDAEKKLAELRKRLSGEIADKEISDNEKVRDKIKERNEIIKESAQSVFNSAIEIMNAISQKEIEENERILDQNQKEEERELKELERSALTEEEKEAQKFGIEQKYQQKRELIENRNAQLRLKQAKLERGANALSIVGNTATAIMKAYAQLGPVLGTGAAIAMGVAGAVQLASLFAQPLPQYYTGTKSSKEGFAHVGEKGTELIVTPSGELKLTPSSDTLTYLEKGTRVYNANDTRRILNGENNNSKYSINLDSLISEQRRSTSELKEAFKSNIVSGSFITRSGWRNQQMKTSKFKNYLKRNGL